MHSLRPPWLREDSAAPSLQATCWPPRTSASPERQGSSD